MPRDRLGLEYVQALRAIAALLVVYYHWEGGGPFLQYGYLGVDLFFVISGFIMAASTEKSDGSFRYASRFFVRRFTRVWPTYAVLSLIVFAFNIIPAPGDALTRLTKSLLFFPMWTEQATLPQGWSLNFEVAFYSMLALSLLFGALRWLVLGTLMLLGLIGLPLLIGHAPSAFTSPPYSPDGLSAYAAMLSQPAMWSFLFGILARMITRNGLAISRPVCISIIAAVAAVAWLVYRDRVPGHDAIVGLMFAVIVMALALADNRRTFNVPRVLIYLGGISYSLYLVHLPIKSVVGVALFRFVSSEQQLWWLFAAYFAGSIACAAASKHLLETKLTDVVRDSFQSRARPVPAAG